MKIFSPGQDIPNSNLLALQTNPAEAAVPWRPGLTKSMTSIAHGQFLILLLSVPHCESWKDRDCQIRSLG